MSTKPPPRKPSTWTGFFRRFTDERALDVAHTNSLYAAIRQSSCASVWDETAPLALTRLIFEGVTVPEAFSEPLVRLIHDLVASDDLITTFPSPQDAGTLSLKEQVELRRFLRAKEHLIAHSDRSVRVLYDALSGILQAIIHRLPHIEAGPSPITVELHTVLPTEVFDTVIAFCCDESLENAGLLHSLRARLFLNGCMAAGIEPDSGKKVPLPTDLSKPVPDVISSYFAGTPFLDFLNTPVPFRIARERYNEHGFMFARSGHGKTQALRALVAQFLQEPDPPALFLIDSLGALIKGIEDLEVFDTALKDKLVILDPSRPEHTPRLNFFGIQDDAMIFYLFKSIDQTLTQRQATMVSYVMEYMRQLPNPTLFQLTEVLQSKVPLHPEVIEQLSPFARAFFETQFYGKGDAFIQQTKAQLAQRLFTLGRLPKFIDIFSAPDKLFDPYECMQSHKIVLINTDARAPKNGGLGEASPIFGRFILAQCLEAARTRPEHQRDLALIVCDEAKAYLDDQSALILSDARQYGLGMLLASQQPHQLPEGVRREVNTNTSIRFMGNIEHAVAAQYARDMFCEPPFIIGMKKYDRSHAEWAVHVSGLDRALRVRMPFGVLEKMPKRKRVVVAPTVPLRDRVASSLDFDDVLGMKEAKKAEQADQGPKPEPSSAPSSPPNGDEGSASVDDDAVYSGPLKKI